ncbi:amidohydrolase family protein [Streptomyces albipurpureus]|uniref:Amidohydrolase n=1 Tax=Streptomyces albipurpureus TaxID=2897419 RepID=A0ABT0USD3_9ACTN|nr:amidohydrolase family protein [Streptomyces sp. CWNU-1]MCM2390879.1 amidohydrolase [Streptomyces sp. CWNU-1]
MIDTPTLVDQHCHGVLRTELGLGTFEARLGQAPGPPASGTTFFDTQTGFAVRRWCPPLLGLEPHCPPAHYLARRRELGPPEVGRRLLRGSGIGVYLVDTGLPDDLTGPSEIASAGAAEAREIVRLEPLAEQVADTSGTVEAFLVNLADAMHTAASSAVAFTSATAAGLGPALIPAPPGPGEVRGAIGRWLPGRRAGSPVTDPVLVRHLLWIAIASGLPLQLPLGGRDPMALAEFAAATAGCGSDLVLLHGYPHHRRTAHLASVFPHVYADLGTAPVHVGSRAAAVLAESLEVAPLGKLLYASGARGLPELHVVAARVFAAALSQVLGGWVSDGSWSRADADRVAGMIAAGNARRLYGLTASGPGAPTRSPRAVCRGG